MWSFKYNLAPRHKGLVTNVDKTKQLIILKELSSGWFKINYGMRQRSIFLPVLVNAMMDEITNEGIKKNKRPEVKILILADIA
jgi:hypothetical protein